MRRRDNTAERNLMTNLLYRARSTISTLGSGAEYFVNFTIATYVTGGDPFKATNPNTSYTTRFGNWLRSPFTSTVSGADAEQSHDLSLLRKNS